MEISIENVTPAKATAWLNKNNVNRTMRPGVAEQYAEDMRGGRWTSCPVPISFYEDGNIADGQHRLWAIVDSGCAQRFPVARGLKREDGLNIDTGKSRSIVDNAKISGTESGLTNELLAIARGAHEGSHANLNARKMRSNGERLAMFQQHRDAVAWVHSNGPRGKSIRNAIVMAAMVRAWYIEKDHDRLRRFADVLTSGLYDGEDETSAVALRNYILTKHALNTSGLWRDTFLKSQNAISYFMQGKKLTVIKAVQDEAYPLKRPRK